MPRFSITKMMAESLADPAAKAADLYQDESTTSADLDKSAADMNNNNNSGLDSSAHRKEKRGSSRSSLTAAKSPAAHRGSIDSLEDLENFAMALQRVNPTIVARAINEEGKRRSSRGAAATPPSA